MTDRRHVGSGQSWGRDTFRYLALCGLATVGVYSCSGVWPLRIRFMFRGMVTVWIGARSDASRLGVLSL